VIFHQLTETKQVRQQDAYPPYEGQPLELSPLTEKRDARELCPTNVRNFAWTDSAVHEISVSLSLHWHRQCFTSLLGAFSPRSPRSLYHWNCNEQHKFRLVLVYAFILSVCMCSCFYVCLCVSLCFFIIPVGFAW